MQSNFNTCVFSCQLRQSVQVLWKQAEYGEWSLTKTKESQETTTKAKGSQATTTKTKESTETRRDYYGDYDRLWT